MKDFRMRLPWMLLCALLLATGSAMAGQQAPASLLVLSYHDIRDDVAVRGDADAHAVDIQNFAAHLEWLTANGYTPVSLQQIIDASQGGTALPQRPVLLTFDDGLRSVYTQAFPLLRAHGFPALVAVVTDWVSLPAGRSVDYGPRVFTGDDFVTWPQLREMRESGLIEIASHTHDLHRGVQSNPQGNSAPAAITRIHDPATGRYETDAQHHARVHDDLARSVELITRETGHAPRTIVWPYAAYNNVVNDIADTLGMPVSFDLEGARTTVGPDLHGLARLLLMNNPTIVELADSIHAEPEAQNLRALQIDLDAVYDADPLQQERNLDALVERVFRIGPSHVFLQAFADPDGNGSADALYFPNRHMPMRADLFNRVAWQLSTRANVVVYAWLPVLGYELPDLAQRERLALPTTESDGIFRLDFTNPEARQIIREIYTDLAASAALHGLLFHDDAYLRDTELPDLFPGDVAARTRALIDFTLELRDAAQRWRPKLGTVRNLYARPVLEPDSQAWFAQRLDLFNLAYNHTAIMAMPWMEGARRPTRWMDALLDAVLIDDPQLHRTMFELQTIDWRTGERIPEDWLKATIRRLQARGVRHFAWYPDDFIGNRPSLPTAREVMSVRAFPYEAP